MERGLIFRSFVFLIFAGLLLPVLSMAAPFKCAPTPPDALGPFYEPGAPVRTQVGQGYELTGVVRSARDCAPVPYATIEFWLAGPDGRYGDDHRATVYPDAQGAYRFESDFPARYYSRPPHIHLRISAEGFQTLITQHYPEEGTSGAQWDLVLVPAP